MKSKMLGRAAFGAVLAALCLTSAHAVPLLNQADFQIVESPGQYTVINNSTDWYVYAFAVENPAAADLRAEVQTLLGDRVQLEMEERY